MNILAIDTSHPVGSVAVSLGDGATHGLSFGARGSHLVELSGAVATVLGKAAAGIGDIDRVALVAGPGSFTGLRIGLAYLKGLYAALELQVVTITGLELLALASPRRRGTVCPMIDARKSEVYSAVYRRTAECPDPLRPEDLAVESPPRAVEPEKLLASETVRPVLFVGSGAVRFRSLIERTFGGNAEFADGEFNQPSTPVLCRVATGLRPLSDREVLELEPLYIRPSDAKLAPLKRVKAHD